MEVIFGTFANDQLKLIQHRAAGRGIQHHHTIAPIDPLPGDPVTLCAWVGVDTEVDYLMCYYTTDGLEPVGQFGESDGAQIAPFRPIAAEWDNLLWGYRMRWEVQLPGQVDRTLVRYRIGGWREGGEELFADFPDVTTIGENAAVAYFKGTDPATLPDPPPRHAGGTVFTYRVDTMSAPAWMRDAVIYHLYVDRFYPGDGKEWIQTADVHHLMGGTLDGARQKLGYLQDLGITCIWLSPTWACTSYHGYDITDFCSTAEHLGGDAALHRFIDAAHARGMRVLLDLPCNHMSDQAPLFQEARDNPASTHRDWFTFDDSPTGYRAFFNLPSMPQINLQHQGARGWMINVARYWLREFDADGFRLDYALGPSTDFWTYFTASCKDEKLDTVYLGEVIDSPGVQRAYIGRLDGCLDFFANEGLRKTFGWKTMTQAEFDRVMTRNRAYFPPGFVLPAFLDNHDMNRFLHIAGGDKEALRQAFGALMRLPNVPIVYYGTEVGVSHAVSAQVGGLDVSREAMLWGADQDAALLADFAGMIAGRRA
ncbi:MAG: alpha-amylase family glycosyl hydrolase [Chloroflexota bacterium]|nr:alpha-amylase family glycosyl hydrolase [Chloroflexota bacterium]